MSLRKCNCINYRFFVLAALCLSWCSFSFTTLSPQVSSESLDEQKNAIIKDGLKLVYSARYEDAIRQFRTIDAIDPECSEGLFFEAFVLELIMDIYRSQAFDDSLSAVLERALPRADAAVSRNPTARNYMFLGGVYGVRGVRSGVLGNWWGAALDGRRAFKHMERAVEIDSTMYDTYYGIGSYHYWRSKKLRRFIIFRFLPDEREKGIKELKLSIERGIFAKTPGRNALFRIYV